MTIEDIGAPRSLQPAAQREELRESAAERAAKNSEIVKAIRTLDEAGGVGPNSELRLAFDRDTGQPLIKVVNRVTNELIAQVPPETILRAAEVLRRLQNGERIA